MKVRVPKGATQEQIEEIRKALDARYYADKEKQEQDRKERLELRKALDELPRCIERAVGDAVKSIPTPEITFKPEITVPEISIPKIETPKAPEVKVEVPDMKPAKRLKLCKVVRGKDGRLKDGTEIEVIY